MISAGTTLKKARFLFTTAAALVGIWWVVLAALVVRTANPVVLPRRQIKESDLVVTGTVQSLQEGIVLVLKTWRGTTKQKEIHVAHLADQVRVAGPQKRSPTVGEHYVFPLKRRGSGSYVVTPRQIGERIRNIYPATDEVQEQLRELFDKPSASSLR